MDTVEIFNRIPMIQQWDWGTQRRDTAMKDAADATADATADADHLTARLLIVSLGSILLPFIQSASAPPSPPPHHPNTRMNALIICISDRVVPSVLMNDRELSRPFHHDGGGGRNETVAARWCWTPTPPPPTCWDRCEWAWPVSMATLEWPMTWA